MADEFNQGIGGVSPANLLEVDFALVVSRLIDAAKSDPAQLRSSVYELARLKLLDQVADENRYEQGRMIEALESAIRGVEVFSQRTEGTKLARLGPALGPKEPMLRGGAFDDVSEIVDRLAKGGRTLQPSDRKAPHYWPSRDILQAEIVPSHRLFFFRRAAFVVGIVAALSAGAVYLQRHVLKSSSSVAGRWPVESQSNDPPLQERLMTARVQPTLVDSADAKAPLLPKTFGVYAISSDRLFELEAFPGRAPDQRIAVSAAISAPSHTSLPDGKVRFIVYRRDTGAPERAEVRVVAKVNIAATSARAGRPAAGETEDVWVIRNVTIGYRVAPVKENPEMYEILNEKDEFALSPGRYALVIKNSAYDFSIAGQVTDSNHCLERFEASNGTFYSPCRKP
jgi:hypothetical protein